MTTLRDCRRYDAVIVSGLLVVAPLHQAVAEKLERVFVGVPNQLTLPPEFPPPISVVQSSGDAAQDNPSKPQSDDCHDTACLANDTRASQPEREPEAKRSMRTSTPESSRPLSELD
jgi:hypothetical protein